MPGTLTIRLEYTGDIITIKGCPCDNDISITAKLFIDYDKRVFSSTITIGDQPPTEFPDTDSVRHYMGGKLTFAKLLQKHLGFVPYYNENNVYISEAEFDSLYKMPVFVDMLGVQVPKAFADIASDVNLSDLKYSVSDMLNKDSNAIIHEALCKLSSASDYTVDDMAVYHALGILNHVINKKLFISGDKLYEDTMHNRMINGVTFPTIYKFALPQVDSHLPMELARYLPEYQKISEKFNKWRKKSYTHSMALSACIEDNIPQ